MKKSTFTGLDYWRLADELSVIDASFLTLLYEPGHFRLTNVVDPSSSDIVQVAGWSDSQIERAGELDDGTPLVNPSQFRAVFKALRNAILSNKLKAKVVNRGRKPEYGMSYDDAAYKIPPDPDEEERSYGFAISRGIPTIFSNADSILNTSGPIEQRVLYVLREPDWSQTTIELEELKKWFKSRGVAPVFFFPEGVADGFRDKDHPRYSAKLATAVAAWEAVKAPAKHKSAKQTLSDWIIGNGVRFELSNEDGVVSPTAADEIAKVANWKTTGGANPTNPQLEELEPSNGSVVQNFEQAQVKTRQNPYEDEKIRDLDDDIPF